jgi:hypothetical protein
MFTESQEILLKDVINRIVPAEGEFPGAGDLGVVEYLDRVVAESPALTAFFLPGLAHIEITANRTCGKGFERLSAEERDQVLRQVEQERPNFFSALVQQTYNGYYTNPAIYRMVGPESHDPQPKTGQVRPFDPRLLDDVRKLGRIYRET